MNNIRELSASLCTGCGACMNSCPRNCIRMECGYDGFLYPQIDEKFCIKCGLCKNSCPVLNPLSLSERQPAAYAVCSRDDTIREGSSSGGIFSELAKIVLSNGGAVFGAAYDAQFQVIHICVENEHDLSKLRGAKYAQSNLLNSFADARDRLEKGQYVLFSGTPCQIAGLKRLLKKEYHNLTTVDFVCHSVPSPMAWHEYVRYRAEQDNDGELPTSINLRSKKTGWSRYQYSNLFEYANSPNHVVKSNESLYMKLFVGGYINRESCENCHFKGYSRVSDLTIGDFWGIWDIAPEMDDNRGTSVVLVQSAKGAQLLDIIRDKLVTKPVTLEEVSAQNPSMLKSSPSNVHRGEVLQLIQSGDFERCRDLVTTPRVSFGRKILRKARSLLS